MKFRKSTQIVSGLQIDIVPLIDCVFQLLIFFMLTSNFVVIPGIHVKLPKALTSEEMSPQSLTIVISSEDIIYIEGKPHAVAEVEKMLEQNKYDSIFMRSDRDATLGVVVKIWDMCKRFGIEKIGIATTYDE